MSINEIFVNHTLTQEEYLNILRVRIKYTKDKIQSTAIALAALLLITLYASIFVDKYFLIFLGVVLFFIYGFVYVLYSQPKWIKSPLNRNTYAPTQYIFDEYGMREKSDLIESKQKWSFFVGWQKVADFYLLFVDKVRFYPIPENAIPLEQREAFKKLVEENIKPLPKK